MARIVEARRSVDRAARVRHRHLLKRNSLDRLRKKTSQLSLSEHSSDNESAYETASETAFSTISDADSDRPSTSSMKAMASSNLKSDIVSELPRELAFQVISTLSDTQKINFSSVCKSWNRLAEQWQEAHTQVIKKKYEPFLGKKELNWNSFKESVKKAALTPSANPSGIMETDNTAVQYHNTKNYVAWIDNADGDLWIGTLRKLATVEAGEGRIDELECVNIAELLDLEGADGEFQNQGTATIEQDNTHRIANIICIEDEYAMVVVAVGHVVTRYVSVDGLQHPVREKKRFIDGFFGIEIISQKLVWTRDRDGAIGPIPSPSMEEPDTYFVKDYVHGHSTEFMLYSDNLFLKATTSDSPRIFQLWHMDPINGEQTCIQKDLFSDPQFDFAKQPGLRYEPAYSTTDYRWNYRADNFDIKLLPFTNSDGKKEFAAITWSLDFTSRLFAPEHIKAVKDKLAEYNPADDEGNPIERPLIAEDGAYDLEVLATKLVKAGVVLYPNGQDMEAVIRNQQIIAAEHRAGRLPDPDFIHQAMGSLLMMELEDWDAPQPQARECSRTMMLIINTTTGELVDTIKLPNHQFRIAIEDIDETAMQNLAHRRNFGERAEILEYVNGTEGSYQRYPIGMQIYTRDFSDSPSTNSQHVTVDIVQYTGLHRICSVHYPSHSPFHTPESWTLTITHNPTGTFRSFIFTTLTNTLYKIFAFRLIMGLPSKFIINPSLNLALDNADLHNYMDQFIGFSAADLGLVNADDEDPHINPDATVGAILPADATEADIDAAFQAMYTGDQGAAFEDLFGGQISFQPPQDLNDMSREVIPDNMDVYAEILKFEAVEEYGFVKKDEEGREWEMKWMEVKERSPVFRPAEEGVRPRRVGWGMRFPGMTRADESEPMEVGEGGFKLGGVWVWN
ncbi:hypothetical protein BJ508DRAFT_366321 [Ascobolus immersus RN42]|uniref:F-box domain-containing protein n=1 Tax=Ascobolus immersus RN42 TaxID=1160509 RepID=A0A3N4HP86_ASCIM|nr:hypothetical protein BJ508DRAFT_366321 [Ascobolus immersus RN42]